MTVDAGVAVDAPLSIDAADTIDAGPTIDGGTTVDAAGTDATPDATPPDAGPLAQGLSTLAGAGETGSVDGFREAARFNNPANVAVAADGTIYVADFDNGSIREISSFGDVTTLTQQGGFQRPFGLVASSTGVLYAQTDRNLQLMNGGALWSINTTTGVASLLLNNIGRPRGFAELADGRLVMAFYQEHVIKVYDPSTPATPPVVIAGGLGVPGMMDDTGTAARFNLPYDVVAVSATSVVVADRGNNRLRLVDVGTGVVTTFAGDGTAATTDGAAAAAQFNVPQGLARDASGNIYVSELGGYVIRKVAGGQVTTVAGDGTAGFLDSVTPLTGKLFGLEGIAITSDGTTLYIADGNRGEVDPYNRIRRLTLP